jgi:hypothetical protein
MPFATWLVFCGAFVLIVWEPDAVKGIWQGWLNAVRYLARWRP